MRVLQIVTLVSPTGAFGGPTRVAMNQCAALRKLGHDVTLAAGAVGYERIPSEIDETPARLFKAHRVVPGTGFAGLFSPGLIRWLRSSVHQFDVIHVHLARDLITLPAAAIAVRHGVPLVTQSHGMIDAPNRLLAWPTDAIFTKPILSAAQSILYLTDRERDDLSSVGAPSARMEELPNGVPLLPGTQPTTTGDRELLFVARLHAIKRPVDFVDAAIRLSSKHPDWRFTLVGPDEGEGAEVTRLTADHPQINWEGALNPKHVLARMRQASAYVLPSEYESYGMTVLEAMSVGLPCVVTHGCALAPSVEACRSGLVTDGTIDDLAQKMDRIISDEPLRQKLSANALTMALNNSIESVANRLVSIYESVHKEAV